MIYFISDGQYVKIGFTDKNDVFDRLHSLQVGNPRKLEVIGVIDGDRQVERILHTVFSPLRAQGEWFKIERDTGINVMTNVQLKLNQVSPDQLTGTRSLVYEAYQKNPAITQREIAETLGISRQMVGKHVKALNGALK